MEGRKLGRQMERPDQETHIPSNHKNEQGDPLCRSVLYELKDAFRKEFKHKVIGCRLFGGWVYLAFVKNSSKSLYVALADAEI